MNDKRIELMAHDPGWATRYKEEVVYLWPVLGDLLAGLHHIGSTAISGIYAKPIIDILGAAHDIRQVVSCNIGMEKLGYIHKGEYGIPGRRYFVRYKDVENSHIIHIHVFQWDHPDITRHLAFRDYLNTHPEEALRYEALKLSLADKYADQRERYTDGKSALIHELDRKASVWREESKLPPYYTDSGDSNVEM